MTKMLSASGGAQLCPWTPLEALFQTPLINRLIYAPHSPWLELGRYRFFKSVSVFGFLVGFSKVGIGFGIGFAKYRDNGFGFFRTNLPLLIE